MPINAIKSPEIGIIHISVFTLFDCIHLYFTYSLFNKRVKTILLSFLQFNLPVCDLFYYFITVIFILFYDSSLPIKKHTF